MSNDFDSMFEAYANQQEQEAKSSNRGSSFVREYESIKFTGLETNKAKIVRVIGGPPDSKLDNYTAKTATIAWLIGDDGKKFKVVRPSLNEDPNYILNKIISKVTAVKWVNKEKTYPVRDTMPEIYNIIDKNGLDITDPRAKFEKGWKGKEVLLMNVIDRAQMDWHREHKHTMILAKSINVGSDGTEYPDEGVSSYAIGPKLNHLFRSYGSWQKYDMAITKTGIKDNPFIVVNATHSPMEVDAASRSYISQNTDLTDEEMSWERYDLAKIYGPTSATKIYNRLKNTIKRIDAALGTHYLEELAKQAGEEKIKWAEMYPQDTVTSTTTEYVAPAVETPVEVTEAPVIKESAPAVRARVANTVQDPWKTLPHGDTLTDEFKSKVKEVVKNSAGEVTDIKWDYPIDQLAACPTCGCPAPLDVTICPNCNLSFI